MSPISAAAPVASLAARPSQPPKDDLRAAFQDTVGSLFYGQMIKALRSGVGKPAYLHGGQAEEMFQTQMDQYVAADLARNNDGGLVEDLYQRFKIDHPSADSARMARPGVFDGRGDEAKTTPFAEPRGRATQTTADISSLSMLRQAAKSTEFAESAEQASWARPASSGAGITTGTRVISALNRK